LVGLVPLMMECENEMALHARAKPLSSRAAFS
jgi:hypothetical protein